MGNVKIRVKVKFFAAPRETVGSGEIEKQIPQGSTVQALLDLMVEEYPALRTYTRFLNVAVNRAYVGMQTQLQDGDTVACLPPVGGG